MVLMKACVRLFKSGLAALLILALTVGGLLADHGTASRTHAAPLVVLESFAQNHQTHPDQSAQHRDHTDMTYADCDATASGCCMAAQCCPGIPVSPVDLHAVSDDDDRTQAPMPLGTGRGPLVVLPPPRSVLSGHA